MAWKNPDYCPSSTDVDNPNLPESSRKRLFMESELLHRATVYTSMLFREFKKRGLTDMSILRALENSVGMAQLSYVQETGQPPDGFTHVPSDGSEGEDKTSPERGSDSTSGCVRAHSDRGQGCPERSTGDLLPSGRTAE